MPPNKILFDRIAIIGIGLIGSSLALAIRKNGLANYIVCGDASELHVKKALELELADEATTDNASAVKDADLVILATPVGAIGRAFAEISKNLKKGCIVTDVGSVKQSVIKSVMPNIPKAVHFVPAHPIAGTEDSGPEAGFAELFQDRWCILTPLPKTNDSALDKVKSFWKACGAKIETMSPEQHDAVLAVISHLPHAVAFSAILTATRVSQEMEQEILKYSGSSFRDFTRVAASDPIMWRDIFLNNRETILEIIEKFKKDLAELELEISNSDGDAIENRLNKSRAVRRNLGSGRFG